jgi:hypothetical protein
LSVAARGLAVACVLAALVVACSTSSTTQCDCADPGITITIPEDVATSSSAPQLSGPACAGVTATCTNTTGGCSAYRFTAKATGTCHVEVAVANTTFTADVTIIENTGCCAGFYPSPISSGTIDVPEPSSPDDGGVG